MSRQFLQSSWNFRRKERKLTRTRRAILMAALAGVLLPNPALAYIGPGAGLGAIAVAVALILGVLFLAVGLVWYPLKRLFNRNKASKEAKDGSK